MYFISKEIFGDEKEHYLDLEFHDGYAVGFDEDGITPKYIATYPKAESLTTEMQLEIVQYDGIPFPRDFSPRDICLKFGELNTIAYHNAIQTVSDRFAFGRPNHNGTNDKDNLRSYFMFYAGIITDEERYDANCFSMADKFELANELFEGFWKLWGETNWDELGHSMEDAIIIYVRQAMQEYDKDSKFFIEL